MARVIGQKLPLSMLYNSLKAGKCHHSLLFHGPQSVGKFESAMNLAKSFFCEQGPDKFCDKCRSCLDIHLYRHPEVHVLSNDDRITTLRFAVKTILQNQSDAPNRMKLMAVGEAANILARHRYGYLKLIETEKKSFKEGVKLSQKELEETIRSAAEFLDRASRNELGGEDENIADVFETLQNSQDRSIITKEGIEKLTERLKRSSLKRVVIIQNIHLLNPNVVGMFLKLLEEPPENTWIVLITEDLKKVNPAVLVPLRSRCFELAFKALSSESISAILSKKYGLKSLPENIPLTMTKALNTGLDDSGLSEEAASLLLEIFTSEGYNSTKVMSLVKSERISLGTVIDFYRVKLLNALLAHKGVLVEKVLKVEEGRARRLLKGLDEIACLIGRVNIAEDRLIMRTLLTIRGQN